MILLKKILPSFFAVVLYFFIILINTINDYLNRERARQQYVFSRYYHGIK